MILNPEAMATVDIDRTILTEYSDLMMVEHLTIFRTYGYLYFRNDGLWRTDSIDYTGMWFNG